MWILKICFAGRYTPVGTPMPLEYWEQRVNRLTCNGKYGHELVQA